MCRSARRLASATDFIEENGDIRDNFEFVIPCNSTLIRDCEFKNEEHSIDFLSGSGKFWAVFHRDRAVDWTAGTKRKWPVHYDAHFCFSWRSHGKRCSHDLVLGNRQPPQID